MQPKMCSKCKKNIAVVFITKVENGVSTERTAYEVSALTAEFPSHPEA